MLQSMNGIPSESRRHAPDADRSNPALITDHGSESFEVSLEVEQKRQDGERPCIK